MSIQFLYLTRFTLSLLQFLFYKLIKKGGGAGPVKPWQPTKFDKVPIPVR